MQELFSYYAIHGALRYYDKNITKSWPEPVHQYFINLNLTSKSLDAFTKRFGLLFWMPDAFFPEAKEQPAEALRDEESRGALQPSYLGNPALWNLYYEFAQKQQRVLREAWKGERDALSEIAPGNIGPPELDLDDDEDVGFIMGRVRLQIDIGPNGIDLRAMDLWSYIRFAFLFDYQKGKTKICANQDCSTPYFLEARRGQQYCSHECAVLINVRRFRARAKKRGKKSGRSQKARRK